MTKEELHLWYDFLKDMPVTIKRQKIIGNYIVDFYCSKARLAIELDGFYHHEQEQPAKDLERDRFLNENGIEVIRYPNSRINNDFDNVCFEIEQCIYARISENDRDKASP